MKKVISVSFYFVFSVIISLISFKIVSAFRISDLFKNRPKNGCWELDHCVFQNWQLFIMATALLFPMLVSVFIGYKAKNNFISKETIINISLIFLIAVFSYVIYSLVFEWITTL